MVEQSDGRADTRSRIVEVAARMLLDLGPSAVTTRGVAERAGVQAPTLYRLFGDKDGLLEAVAEHTLSTFVSAKTVAVQTASDADVDPLEDLRASWHRQIDFGLTNPAVFGLLSDPHRAQRSAAARAGQQVLDRRIRRLAAAGLLAVGERRAAGLVHAAGVGVVQALLGTPPDERDHGLADAALDAVLDHILVERDGTGFAPAGGDAVATAVALRALEPDLAGLSDAERALLTEWLDRVVDSG